MPGVGGVAGVDAESDELGVGLLDQALDLRLELHVRARVRMEAGKQAVVGGHTSHPVHPLDHGSPLALGQWPGGSRAAGRALALRREALHHDEVPGADAGEQPAGSPGHLDRGRRFHRGCAAA